MNPMKCKLTFIKLTLNLHLNTSKFPNLGHLLKKKHVFLSFFYSFKKYQTHTSWDRFFRSYVKEFDGWKAPSHAKQLDPRDMLPKQAERSRLLFLSVTSGAVSLQTTHPERLASRHSVSGISPRVGGRANNQNGQRLEPKMTVAKHANPPF